MNKPRPPAWNRKANDENIAAIYNETHSVWETGERLGMCGQSVQERLHRMGITPDGNGKPWTDEDTQRLLAEYKAYADAGKATELAAKMGRTIYFLSRKAKEHGLTDPNRKRVWYGKWAYLSDDAAAIIWEQFKKSNLNLGQFCAANGFDDDGFRNRMKASFPKEWDEAIEDKLSKSTKYQLGRAFEYRVRDRLKNAGYFVMRSPQSKTVVDLLAVKKGSILFVQCKRGGVIDGSEWNELFDLCASKGAIPILAMSPTGRGIELYRITDKAEKNEKTRKETKLTEFVVED